MKILALETSTRAGSVALAEDENLLAEYTLNILSTHSERLLTSIDQILKDTKLTLNEIDGFAVSQGPGSFTGIRIGISTVKGLALATGKKIAGVPTLDVLAFNLVHTPQIICPIIDAKKDEVYTALYRGEVTGTLKKLTEDLTLKPKELLLKIKEPAIFLGDGIERYRKILESADIKHFFAPACFNLPRASVLAKLALNKFQKGDILGEDEIMPLYCRLPDAEIKNQEATMKIDKTESL